MTTKKTNAEADSLGNDNKKGKGRNKGKGKNEGKGRNKDESNG